MSRPVVPTTMRAAAIEAFGPPENLAVREMAVPHPGAGEVLVRVVSAGVQITDAAIRAGWTPPGATITFPQTLGNEFTGVVAALGEDVRTWAVGDPVVGFRLLGCYAEYVAVAATDLAHKPDAVAWDQAGALSASGQTAHTVLEDLGVTAGETLVVHGAAGGVGTMAVQLAVAAGATVVGTASPANHEYLRALGAIPVGYGAGQRERIRAAAPAGVDVVLDAAGHGDLRDAVELVADRSRIGTIADMTLAPELGVAFLRSRRSAERLRTLLAALAAGELTVHVRRTVELERVADAHRDVETGHGRGKVVLTIGSGEDS